MRCEVERITETRRRLKRRLLEEFGGCCMCCGYDRCPEALHFHHRDPATKEFAITGTGNTRAWAKLVAEAEKCDLLCANCHAEAHSALR